MRPCARCGKQTTFDDMRLVHRMYDGKKDNLLCESCQKEWDELWQKTFHVEIITYPITGPNKPEQMWHDFMAKAKVRVDFT